MDERIHRHAELLVDWSARGAVHVDLITETGDGSRLEVDGELIQRDGRFRWEDGFEERSR